LRRLLEEGQQMARWNGWMEICFLDIDIRACLGGRIEIMISLCLSLWPVGIPFGKEFEL